MKTTRKATLMRAPVLLTVAAGAGLVFLTTALLSRADEKKPDQPDTIAAPLTETRVIERVTAATDKALDYLESKQIKQGDGAGAWSTNQAFNALAMLAFMSSGHTPGRGKYGDVIEDGVRQARRADAGQEIHAVQGAADRLHLFRRHVRARPVHALPGRDVRHGPRPGTGRQAAQGGGPDRQVPVAGRRLALHAGAGGPGHERDGHAGRGPARGQQRRNPGAEGDVREGDQICAVVGRAGRDRQADRRFRISGTGQLAADQRRRYALSCNCWATPTTRPSRRR